MRAFVEAETLIFYDLHSALAMRRSLRTHMKNTLTLKSISKSIPTHDNPALPIQIQAGRQPKKGQPKDCTALLSQLTTLIDSGSKVFIQMRNGTGYCGLPTQLADGWLSMANTTIHGTKKVIQVPTILIQVRDGSFIAHIHATDGLEITDASGEK